MHPNFSPLPGFTFVKELTLDVQNVIAPPKEKSSAWKKEDVSSSYADSKTEKKPSSGEEASEKEPASEQSDGKKSDVNARHKNGSLDDSSVKKGVEADGSPQTKDSRRYAFCVRSSVFWIASFLTVGVICFHENRKIEYNMFLHIPGDLHCRPFFTQFF